MDPGAFRAAVGAVQELFKCFLNPGNRET